MSLKISTLKLHRPRRIWSVLCLALFIVSSIAAVPSFSPQITSNASSGSDLGLQLSVLPSVLPADNGTYSSIVIELVNITSGLPAVPASNVTIYLTSSNKTVGNVVQSPITFQNGSLYVDAQFQTTCYPGSTVVTASSNGYATGSVTVTTQLTAGSPYALEVYPSPTSIPADERLNSLIFVEAVDAFGNPVELPSSVNVSLSSSNLQVGSVPRSLILTAGESFGNVTFTPTYSSGSTTIEAAANGLLSGNATMTTTGPVARKLLLSVAPSVLYAHAGSTATISVQLIDSTTSTPVDAHAPVQVILTSNNPAIAQVANSTLYIPSGSSYATENLIAQGSSAIGYVNITAAAQGYVATTYTVDVNSTLASYGTSDPFISFLQPYFAPSELLTDNRTYLGGVVVELETLDIKTGDINPATAPVSNVTVWARSSDNATMQVSTASVLIISGSVDATFNITSTYLSGSANVTALANNWNSHTVLLTSFGYIADSLNVQVALPTLIADGLSHGIVTIGLVDSALNVPVEAPYPIVVNLSSSSTCCGSVSKQVTIQTGSSYARANFTTSGIAGSTIITAVAPGLVSSSTPLVTVSAYPDTSLELFVEPNVILAGGANYHDLLAIQAFDASGDLAKSPTNTNVLLDVANSSIGSVSPSITISPYSNFAFANFNTTLEAGNINVTAMASGYSSTSISFLSTVFPMSVSINDTETTVPLGGKLAFDVNVASEGVPLSGAAVSFSLNGGTDLGNVTGPSNTNSQGLATVTYSAGNVLGEIPISVLVTKVGYQAFSEIIDVNVVNPVMNAQLSASPSIISVGTDSNLTLDVTASGSALVNATVQWSAVNGTISNAQFSTNSAGIATAIYFARTIASSDLVQAKITKQGYNPYIANLTLSVIVPVFTVQNTVNPANVQAGQKFTVQLQVSAFGAAASNASLSWNTNATEAGASDFTNSSGGANATFIAGKEPGVEAIQVGISQSGINTYLDNMSVNVYLYNLTATETLAHSSIVTSYGDNVTLHVTSNGVGVPNASITWVVKNGTLGLKPPLFTNGTGYAIATYTSGTEPGNFTIEALISKLGYDNATEKMFVLVAQKSTPAPTSSKILQTNPLLVKVGNVLPVWTFIPIAGAAGGVGFFFFRRYRNGGGYSYDE